MDLFDTNLLLYAADAQSPFHAPAKQAVEAAYNARQTSKNPLPTAAHAWLALIGFVRLSTRKGILTMPLSVEQSMSALRTLLNHPKATMLDPGDDHASILARLLIGAGTAGNLTNDAHLAALAIEHNARLVTFDADFERFAGLKLQVLRLP